MILIIIRQVLCKRDAEAWGPILKRFSFSERWQASWVYSKYTSSKLSYIAGVNDKTFDRFFVLVTRAGVSKSDCGCWWNQTKSVQVSMALTFDAELSFLWPKKIQEVNCLIILRQAKTADIYQYRMTVQRSATSWPLHGKVQDLQLAHATCP